MIGAQPLDLRSPCAGRRGRMRVAMFTAVGRADIKALTACADGTGSV
jgi:hypothetical protein